MYNTFTQEIADKIGAIVSSETLRDEFNLNKVCNKCAHGHKLQLNIPTYLLTGSRGHKQILA